MEEIQPVSPGPINVRISVANKVAQNDSPEVTLVCGNTDQWVTFSFLEPEWNAYPVKTARFVYFRGGRLQHTDVPFAGAAAPVPLLTQITEVFVGVYAGSLCATTPARVGCLNSIVCNSGGDIPANSEAYAQVLACISRAVYATEAAAAEAEAIAASIRGACSTRLEIIGRAAGAIAPSGRILRVYLDGYIPEGAALAAFRRTTNASSYRQNRWDRRPAGYAEVSRLPFRKNELLNDDAGPDFCPYPAVPAWMPNGGYLQNYFPLTPENIAAGYLDIPDIYNWLLPMVKPGYDYKKDCFDWISSRIIGARYRNSGHISLKTPAELAFAIVEPMEGRDLWEYPVLGRWNNRLSVFGRCTGALLHQNQDTGGYEFDEVFIFVR